MYNTDTGVCVSVWISASTVQHFQEFCKQYCSVSFLKYGNVGSQNIRFLVLMIINLRNQMLVF